MSKEIDVQFIRQNYQKMTDDEIIRITTKDFPDLTIEAQEIAAEEVKRRNLDTSVKIDLNNEEQIQNQQTFIEVNDSKSFELALLLAFLFGPLGLLYTSITNGLFMIILGFIGFAALNYVGLIVAWILSIILAIKETRYLKTNTRSTILNSDNRQVLLDQLSQLHSLREKNVITDDIYEQERKKIMSLFDKKG
jgi:hypothetical protein